MQCSRACAGAAQLALALAGGGNGGRGTVAQVGFPPAWGSLSVVWGLPVRLATHNFAISRSPWPCLPSAPVCGSPVIVVRCPGTIQAPADEHTLPTGPYIFSPPASQRAEL